MTFPILIMINGYLVHVAWFRSMAPMTINMTMAARDNLTLLVIPPGASVDNAGEVLRLAAASPRSERPGGNPGQRRDHDRYPGLLPAREPDRITPAPGIPQRTRRTPCSHAVSCRPLPRGSDWTVSSNSSSASPLRSSASASGTHEVVLSAAAATGGQAGWVGPVHGGGPAEALERSG